MRAALHPHDPTQIRMTVNSRPQIRKTILLHSMFDASWQHDDLCFRAATSQPSSDLQWLNCENLSMFWEGIKEDQISHVAVSVSSHANEKKLLPDSR